MSVIDLSKKIKTKQGVQQKVKKRAWLNQLNALRVEALKYYQNVYKHFQQGKVTHPINVWEKTYIQIYKEVLPRKIKTLSMPCTGLLKEDRSKLHDIYKFHYVEVPVYMATKEPNLVFWPAGTYSLLTIYSVRECYTQHGKQRLATIQGGGEVNVKHGVLLKVRPENEKIRQFQDADFAFKKFLRDCQVGEHKLTQLKQYYFRQYAMLRAGTLPNEKGIDVTGSIQDNLNYFEQYRLPFLQRLTGQDFNTINNELIFINHDSIWAKDYQDGEFALIYNVGAESYRQVVGRQSRNPTVLVDDCGDTYATSNKQLLINPKKASQIFTFATNLSVTTTNSG